jgi:hypothetical protein
LHIDEINNVPVNAIREVRAELSTLQSKLHPNEFFLHSYFSGKCTLFNSIGSGAIESPKLVKWVLLRPLKENHIKEIVQDVVQD